MKKILSISALIITSLAITGIAVGDDDYEEHGFKRWFGERSLDVAPVKSDRYKAECSSCHFAYQPGLLPARSWKKLMIGLEDHFGDNAELDADDHKAILNYLITNAADHSDYKRSRKFANSIGKNEAPLRITDTLYFKRKHDEVPARMVTGNKEVGSFSNCAACHRNAESGSYDEHQIRIPGYGHWDD